jgi:hypothetical protein
MPIYLPNTSLGLPPEFASLLTNIAMEAEGRAVTPAIALKLLQRHLRSAMPLQHQHFLDIQGQPTWEKLAWCYPKMVFASDKGTDLRLTAAAIVVQAVFQYSTYPPRETSSPHTLEVDSFRRMAGYIGLVREPSVCYVHRRVTNLFEFCRYCWRPTIKNGLACAAHSSKSRPGEYSTALGETSVGYKAAQRLRPAFEKQIHDLAMTEELEFHDSNFTLQVFFPAEDMIPWMSTRRPHLCARMEIETGVTSDGDTLRNLWSALYGESVEPELIRSAPQLLTPITLRAEAWLRANSERPSWGGRREGAGLKPTREGSSPHSD